MGEHKEADLLQEKVRFLCGKQIEFHENAEICRKMGEENE
jgi:hypothetical protein